METIPILVGRYGGEEYYQMVLGTKTVQGIYNGLEDGERNEFLIAVSEFFAEAFTSARSEKQSHLGIVNGYFLNEDGVQKTEKVEDIRVLEKMLTEKISKILEGRALVIRGANLN